MFYIKEDGGEDPLAVKIHSERRQGFIAKDPIVVVTYEGLVGAVVLHALGGGKLEDSSPANFVLKCILGLS